ncbi:hypothetical protein IQ07DRAFT_51103 [Pyrenochaeta sp. DS3sAY3a]|nr:hypothetical protein IQ07DRAFT_51103 [Pyrenochaeta sp. DS3sAY3a]
MGVFWPQIHPVFAPALLASSFTSGGRQQPTSESLCKVLLQQIEQVKEVWIILDALDECRTRKGPPIEGLLSWIREVLYSEQRNVHLLVTSRLEQDIESRVMEFARNDGIVPIQSSAITDDIRAYVQARVREDNPLKRWRNRPNVQEEIETRLMEKADGMFRWVACQLYALEKLPRLSRSQKRSRITPGDVRRNVCQDLAWHPFRTQTECYKNSSVLNVLRAAVKD